MISYIAVEKPEPKVKAKKERKSTTSTSVPVDKRHSEKAVRQDSATSSSLDVNEVEIADVQDDTQVDDPYYNVLDSPYRIKVVNLLNYVMSTNVDFEAEFKVYC